MKLGHFLSTLVLALFPAVAHAAITVEIDSKNDVSMDWKEVNSVGSEFLSQYYAAWTFFCVANLEVTVRGETYLYSKPFSQVKKPQSAPPTEAESLRICQSADYTPAYETFINKVQTLGQTQVEWIQSPSKYWIRACYKESMVLYLGPDGTIDRNMGDGGWKALKHIVACP